MNIDRPEYYFKAGVERIAQAKTLYDEKSSYALSMYVSGLAVECLLRAIAISRDPTILKSPDSVQMFKGHELKLWFKKSGLLDFNEAELTRKGLEAARSRVQYRELQSATSRICIVWENLFRFASEDRVRTDLKKKKLDRGIQGDFLKENARILLNASEHVVTKGVFLWNSLRK